MARKKVADAGVSESGPGVKIALWAGFGVFVVLCLWLGAQRAMSYACSLDRYKVNMASVTLSNPKGDAASWMGGDIAPMLRDVALAEQGTSIFDKHLARRLHDRYARFPFVLGVQYVRKEYPNRIVWKVDLRRPLALVATSDRKGQVTVDAEGFRLPDTGYVTPEYRQSLPLIVGVEEATPPEGEGFTGEGVKAGALMALEMLNWRHLFQRVKVAAIDVSNMDGGVSSHGGGIVLVTEGKTRIYWGQPPGQEKLELGEARSEEKVCMLVRYLKHASLDICRSADVRDVDFKEPEVVLRASGRDAARRAAP